MRHPLSRRTFLTGIGAGFLAGIIGHPRHIHAGDDTPPTPTVFRAPRYAVEKTTHIYAQGLSHTDWNSPDATPLDIALDLFTPIDAPPNRPAMVCIHGGGLQSGTRELPPELVQFAREFAARGWVTCSIDYRLAQQRGTLPAEWLRHLQNTTAPELLDVALAAYPAGRDAKAAVRWLYANADTYHINTDYIAALGDSAGGSLAVMLGVTEPEDYRDELTLDDDPTLGTANLDQPAAVAAVIEFWGASDGVDAYNAVYTVNRWDETDAPLMIVHGTADEIVPFRQAELLRDYYIETGVDYSFYAVDDGPHHLWGDDEIPFFDWSFDFLVTQLALTLGD